MRRFVQLLLLSVVIFSSGCNATAPKDSNKTSSKNGEDTTIVVLETNQGNIELKMLPKVAPLAVENFVTHSKNGYYNGLIFHRVIKGFMIQGGDPTGTGTGGESIWKKEFINEYAPNVVFDKPFILAMANHGPNTNGSQFFITTVPTPHLNGGYTIFGEVVSGSDVVQKIENTKTGRADRPVEEQKIIKAYIK
ncbi:Peptidyl-prolyl cis-trans isomerase [hydrothermal vent metagenome]|uniref:peptidylprolyl isomerase n=1 Tax=hydrothermal vent metagenome TaxID=652676 RepID=A0A1W1CG38_9ZZZZ